MAISVDAGRNSWFVSQKKMKTLHLVPPQARHYVSDVSGRRCRWTAGKESDLEKMCLKMSLDTALMPDAATRQF